MFQTTKINSSVLMAVYFIVLALSNLWAQQETTTDKMSFEELEVRFINAEGDVVKETLSDLYLQKAKTENNRVQIAKAYGLKVKLFSHTEKAISYADSIIQITSNLKGHELYPAEGYLLRGIQLYYQSRHNLALDDFIKANDFFSTQENTFKLMVVKHYVALLKNVTGEDDESLRMLQSNIGFFDTDEKKLKYNDQYLKSLFALANAYNVEDRYDSAIFHSRKGMTESAKRKDKYLHHFFLLTMASAQFEKKNYRAVQQTTLQAIKYLKNQKKELATAYFNLSDAYFFDSQKEKGLLYLKKVDSMYKRGDSQVIYAAKDSYELMLSQYGDLLTDRERLAAIDNLLNTYELLNKKFGNLDRKISDRFESSVLLRQKELTINNLKKKNRNRIAIIIGLVAFSIFLLFLAIRYYRTKVVYKKRYEQYTSSLRKGIEKNGRLESPSEEQIEEIGISQELINNILEGLKDFETDKLFVKNHYNLANLANKLDTNPRYLSKIVNTYKGKGFSAYINELRVNCAIDLLEKDKKYRLYTIEAIALEVGFNRVQTFSKAFLKHTGLYPGQYITQMKRNEKQQKVASF